MNEYDTTGPNKNELKNNIVRLAVVIFFVVTVSVAGGFLQNDRVAVGSGSSVAAADAGLKNLDCTSTYCTQPDGVGGNNTITCSGTSGACKLTTSPSEGGESFDLDAQTSKNMRSAMEAIRSADSEGGCSGADRFSPRCLDKCTTSFIAITGSSEPKVMSCVEQTTDPVRQAIDKVVYFCPEYQGNWRNVWQDYQCNATPRTDGAQKTTPATPDGNDTLPAGQRSAQDTTTDFLAAALAAERSEVWVNPDTGRPTGSSGGSSQACVAAKTELATAIKTSLETGKKAQGGTPSQLSCQLGATVCFLSTGLSTAPTPTPPKATRSVPNAPVPVSFASSITTAGDVKCCNKHDKACVDQFNKTLGLSGLDLSRPGVPTTPQTPQDPCDGLGVLQEKYCRFQQGGGVFGGNGRLQDSWGFGWSDIADRIGLGLGMSIGRLGFSFDWFGGDDDEDVSNQYRGSTASSSVQPQCVIAASKEFINAGETVSIRWRTSDADTVSISNVGDSVEKNDQKSVTPYKTTTYRLTAKKGDSVERCDVTVNVRGSFGGDPTGVAPPRLSCLPSLIQPDESSTIKWQCTGEAESTTSEGIDTEGDVSGEITVDPEFNTEYSVSCLDEEGEEIGKNVCSVGVGEPLYDIIVTPTTAKRGDQVRVSWSSLFMKSCRVTGPRSFDYTRTQGVVITEPFARGENQVPGSNIRAAVYTITCDSLFDGSYTRDVEVAFEAE